MPKRFFPSESFFPSVHFFFRLVQLFAVWLWPPTGPSCALREQRAYAGPARSSDCRRRESHLLVFSPRLRAKEREKGEICIQKSRILHAPHAGRHPVLFFLSCAYFRQFLQFTQISNQSPASFASSASTNTAFPFSLPSYKHQQARMPSK